MPESKQSFWREVFTWRATQTITRHGARFLTALAVAVLAPVCYVVGWFYLPYGLWRRARDRRGDVLRELQCRGLMQDPPTQPEEAPPMGPPLEVSGEPLSRTIKRERAAAADISAARFGKDLTLLQWLKELAEERNGVGVYEDAVNLLRCKLWLEKAITAGIHEDPNICSSGIAFPESAGPAASDPLGSPA